MGFSSPPLNIKAAVVFATAIHSQLGFANCSDLKDGLNLERHDNLAEMLVSFHVVERLGDVVEWEHLVDRQF